MNIFEFYKHSGIDLKEHNGDQFYAVRQNDALVLVDLLNQNHVIVHSVEVLKKDETGHYTYITSEPMNWDFDQENIPEEERYDVIKEKIETIAEKENIAFLFSDEQSYKAWKMNHANFII